MTEVILSEGNSTPTYVKSMYEDHMACKYMYAFVGLQRDSKWLRPNLVMGGWRNGEY